MQQNALTHLTVHLVQQNIISPPSSKKNYAGRASSSEDTTRTRSQAEIFQFSAKQAAPLRASLMQPGTGRTVLRNQTAITGSLEFLMDLQLLFPINFQQRQKEAILFIARIIY